jgi:hypothetical protein
VGAAAGSGSAAGRKNAAAAAGGQGRVRAVESAKAGGLITCAKAGGLGRSGAVWGGLAVLGGEAGLRALGQLPGAGAATGPATLEVVALGDGQARGEDVGLDKDPHLQGNDRISVLSSCTALQRAMRLDATLRYPCAGVGHCLTSPLLLPNPRREVCRG